MVLTNSFFVTSGLVTEVYCKILGYSLCVLNVYGPYEGKQEYWNRLLTSHCIRSKNLVVGGDLNLTMRKERFGGIMSGQIDLLTIFGLSLILLDGWTLNQSRSDLPG
jgi:hypothetical protein